MEYPPTLLVNPRLGRFLTAKCLEKREENEQLITTVQTYENELAADIAIVRMLIPEYVVLNMNKEDLPEELQLWLMEWKMGLVE